MTSRLVYLTTLRPLSRSFLTSFMGMNTADIRDMEYRSNLFLGIAIPFTAFVVGLALLYGYKWDLIVERISQLRRPQAAAAAPLTRSYVENWADDRRANMRIPRVPGLNPRRSWPAAEDLAMRLRRRIPR